MKKVSGSKVVTTSEASELPPSAEIQEALGELVWAAREVTGPRSSVHLL